MRVNHRKQNESGLVSIMVATIIMVILTLIVLGFSRIMRREQRSALDRVLSTQAFYAAESGINDAIAEIQAQTAAKAVVSDKSTCNTSAAPYNGSIDTTLGASYSCLLINTTPKSLEFNQKSIDATRSTTVPVSGAHNEVIDKVEIAWDSGATANAFKACSTTPTLPDVTAWGNAPGILHFDLYPTDTLDRASFIANAFSTYLYPAAQTGTCAANPSLPYGNYRGTNAGTLVSVGCDGATTTQPRLCMATITGVNARTLTLRMKSIYNASNVTIKMYDNAGNQLELKGAQAVIDSTGKVQDEVKRLQVRVRLYESYQLPDAAIESSQDVCKQLALDVANKKVIDNCGSLTAGGVVAGATTACPYPLRFPGDTCPAWTGLAYWGSAYTDNGDPTARYETPTGYSLATHRTYWQWSHATNPASAMYATVLDDIQHNRLPIISVKPPLAGTGVSTWNDVANGTYDVQLRAMIANLKTVSADGPVWFIFHHEPEGGGNDGNNPDDGGNPSHWRNMQKHFRQVLNASPGGAGNIAFMSALMTYTWDPVSGRDPDSWWEPGIWDALLVDHFHDQIPGDMFDTKWNNFIDWVLLKNIPFGTSEWGNRPNDATAATEMQAFWDWRKTKPPVGSAPFYDMLAYGYFDSVPNGNWLLAGPTLAKFYSIMKDPGVARINDFY